MSSWFVDKMVSCLGLRTDGPKLSVYVILSQRLDVSKCFNLSFDGVGGGVESIHTIFVCENNRKSNKITHCVVVLKLCMGILR